MMVDRQKNRWMLAAGGALAGTIVIFLLFRSPESGRSSPGKIAIGSSNVGLSIINGGAGESLLQQETTLRDPTPLFLPTPLNAGEGAIPTAEQREPGGGFSGYQPKLIFAENELQLQLKSPVAVPGSPVQAFGADQQTAADWGMGRLDSAATPLAKRGAFVEVLAAGDGRSLLAQALTEARPPGETPWQPLQFLVGIDATGVVGSPILTESSRVAAVDRYFQNFVVETLRIGERLGPGFYRISIGP